MAFAASGADSTGVFSSASYLPFGPARSITYNDGITETLAYDHDNNLATQSGTGINLAYGYDNANNLSTITDAITASNSQTFGYDALNRLTSAVSGSGGYGTLGYIYNANGNLTSSTDGGGTSSYTVTANTNRVTAISGAHTGSYSYSTAGNISGSTVDSVARTYSYNAANRLSGVSGTGLTDSYLYGASGQRAQKISNSVTSKYIYDPAGHLLAEANASATPTLEHIYLGDRLVAQYNPVSLKLLTVHTDRMGSPMLVNDKTAALQWKTNYLPYGQTVNNSGSATQNVRLPGQYADASTSLYDNGFRTYSEGPGGILPGRYMQADPIGFAGGLNPYAYVGLNPLNGIDPKGLSQFAIRPLKNIPYIPLPVNTGWHPYHEQLFSNKYTGIYNGRSAPQNVGYFGDRGISYEGTDGSDYTMYGPYYDDDTMITAKNNLADSGQWDKDDYVDFGSEHHNCQDFAQALRDEYLELGGTTCSVPFENGQCSIPDVEHYNTPINDPYHHTNQNFQK